MEGTAQGDGGITVARGIYGKAGCDTQRHGPIDKVVLGHGLE